MSNGLAEAFHFDAPDAADAPHSDTIDDFSAHLLWEQRAITRERLADAERHWAAALDGELPVL